MIDDDLDPVEEVRAIRQKIWRKYKTMDAYFDHFETIPSAEVLLARVQAKLGKTEVKNKPSRRPAQRRRKQTAKV